MSRCSETITWDVGADTQGELACTLGAGHKAPHHTQIKEMRESPDGGWVEAITDIRWAAALEEPEQRTKEKNANQDA